MTLQGSSNLDTDLMIVKESLTVFFNSYFH